jgi:L-amino acid N-acyltransferase YncA
VEGYDTRVATADDVPAIVALQDQNLRETGGTLSVRFPEAWFEKAIADMPIVVALRDENLIGYVVSTPIAAQAHVPIVAAMLRVHPGAPGAYLYGPVCVAEAHRGRHVALAMFEYLRAQLPGREGFTFIRADNASSRTAHRRMGIKEVAAFEMEGVGYIVAAYQG